jgi:TnpA family transposase
VPGTPRDSLFILDTLLNLDAGPKPEVVTTDNASYSDTVFGLFAILGYRFAPRFADLPDQRYWRAPLPDPLPDPLPAGVQLSEEQARIDGYGALEVIARHTINVTKIETQWSDMLRVAGSLVTNQVRAYDLVRMFGRDRRPSPPGQAFVEYGRIAKTLHPARPARPDRWHVSAADEPAADRPGIPAPAGPHRLSRQPRPDPAGLPRGQEDQLAALGLVLNAVVLWNTR